MVLGRDTSDFVHTILGLRWQIPRLELDTEAGFGCQNFLDP